MATTANKIRMELLPPFYPPEGPEVAPDHEEVLPDSMQQGPHIHRTGQTDWESFYEIMRPDELPPLVGDTDPVYYRDSDGRTRLVIPDIYFAFNVNMAAIVARNAYFVEEVGKAPDVVLEVGSVSTYENDLHGKRDLYMSLGVKEYLGFDPTGGDYYGVPLWGVRLVDGEYVDIEVEYDEESGVARAYSQILDMYVCVERETDERYQGGIRLRFQDRRTGQYLRTPRESEAALRESEVARGVLETELNIERAARRADQERIRELQERLRRLGQ